MTYPDFVLPALAGCQNRLVEIVVYCFFLFYSPLLRGQEAVREYVQRSTVPIKSISPDSVEFSDLEVIGNAIGDCSIVFLGEQDHGDAPSFLAKSRLIKYLHEKKGFDVLAFESDFFSLTSGWDDAVAKKAPIDTFIRGNVFGVWTTCNACNQLFYNYIPKSWKTSHPLFLTGFDDQLFLAYSSKNLIQKLDSVLARWKIPLTAAPNYATEILPLLNSVHDQIRPSLDSSTLKRRGLYLEQVKSQLVERLGPADYWVVVIDNLIQENLQFMYQHTDYWRYHNLRDEQMAYNLKWIAENKYPGKKIIVWAANYHISKFNAHYPESFLNGARTMGGIFTADSVWGNKTYIMGFSSLEGAAGRMGQSIYNLPKANANSFERWINAAYSYAFTDFRPFNRNNPGVHKDFFMSGSVKGNALHSHHKAQWNSVFDGVFFIRTMYSCQSVVN